MTQLNLAGSVADMDPLISKIEELTKAPNLEPETLILLRLALEAQRTGKMPHLPVGMHRNAVYHPKPVTFLDCTGTNNGVGKITAPQRLR